ncbi:HPF/RaiA family ribosome-associated protein [Anaeromyxobacter terrae]|uniref:HPF/RaiA family ribosome-associated protein n=1 Tax=Anaeromyxobacter terrae TaxID=2925406 RepID=UPI001F58CFA7|nr:HPF/RaiA family ribosome-associated protein [Anaeromyxobacter sp. SG22]
MRARGFSITPGLRGSIERRLAFALDRYAQRIARVRVVVGDLNGPKGGEDKFCRVEVRLRGARTVRATAVDGDAYAAIGAAAHRAGRAVARALARERTTMLELLWLARTLERSPSAA